MRVLIAGCGYVGNAAARLFAADNHDVSGWRRDASASSPAVGIALSSVDVSDAAAVLHHAFPADVVVHCASSGGGDADAYRAVYYQGAVNLLRAFPRARFLFTSSTSVYAQSDGSWVSETSPTLPQRETGRILRETEELVLQRDGVVLRLGGIYGPGRSALLRAMREGTAAMSDEDHYVNQVHRDDIASAIVLLALARDLPTPRVFNVVDHTPALRNEIISWLASYLQIPLSSEAAEPASRRRGRSNKRVSNARLRALGWKPVFPSYREAFLHSILAA
ncbi:MAG: NAD-dependent epimerase/dehydratase family protein [Verrucomicrobiota bacterium]